MKKSRAIELLGGTVTAAADAMGVTSSAVSQWPDELTHEMENRVLAALARQHLPAELLGNGEPEVVSDASG
jgi:DNA-binding transcriptional regulator YdaS (Cro superfamily)